MKCPACHASQLSEVPTRNGVVVDTCAACGGVWLDRGEIFLFSKNPQKLDSHFSKGLADSCAGDRPCPRCAAAMHTGKFPGSAVEIDQCPRCHGLWLDAGEMRAVLDFDQRLFNLQVDPMRGKQFESVRSSAGTIGSSAPPTREPDAEPHRRLSAIASGMMSLPNLFVRSASVMILLYGLLFAALIAVAEIGWLPFGASVGIGVVIVIAQFLLGPFIMDLSLRWLYNMTWLTPDQLPSHLRAFVDRVTTENKMKFPSFGLIHDGAPNAFTYGHTPNNMRIVISQGILDLLEPEEAEAVVAHEIGHGKHWDMALMTVAQLVPLLLYYTYRTLIRMRSGSDEDKTAPARFVIAIGAYILYIISEYIVLWFSRCREYHADRFAGRATGNPNFIAAALVKIAYGLASRGGKKSADDEQDSKQASSFDAIGALGIFDPGAARGLVVAASKGTDTTADSNVGKENLKSAMQWDLWNPWAKWYELHSTHPLIANRLQYLADQSAAMGIEPYIVFDRRQPESYWDDFFVDVSVGFLPTVLPLATAAAYFGTVPSLSIWMPGLGLCLVALGVGQLIKVLFSYRGKYFAPLSIAGLLHKVKVSKVRPVPVRVRGRIIGRGVPGLVWSEDFVMRDETGILFLDYRQPLGLWEFFFGLLGAGHYQGKDVEVTGWYRRAPVPYLEIKTITEGGRSKGCYVYHVKLFVAGLLIVGGCVVTVMGFMPG